MWQGPGGGRWLFSPIATIPFPKPLSQRQSSSELLEEMLLVHMAMGVGGRARWENCREKTGGHVHEGSLNFLGVDPLFLLFIICKDVDLTSSQLQCNQNPGLDTTVAFADSRMVKFGTWGPASSTPSFPVGESLTFKLHEMPHLWVPSLTLVSTPILCHCDQQNNGPQRCSHPNPQNP